jgi:hypothetical protein
MRTRWFGRCVVCGLCLSAASASEEFDNWDFRQGYDIGLSMQVISGEFTLGSVKYDWDEAYRYQLNFGAKALSFDPE